MTGYSDVFTSNAFVPDTTSGKFKMTITSDKMPFNGGTAIRLSKLLRHYNGAYHNTIEAYEVTLSGDLLIYSDEAFSGMLVVTSDE